MLGWIEVCRDRFINLITFGGKTQFGLMCVCVCVELGWVGVIWAGLGLVGLGCVVMFIWVCSGMI